MQLPFHHNHIQANKPFRHFLLFFLSRNHHAVYRQYLLVGVIMAIIKKIYYDHVVLQLSHCLYK